MQADATEGFEQLDIEDGVESSLIRIESMDVKSCGLNHLTNYDVGALTAIVSSY